MEQVNTELDQAKTALDVLKSWNIFKAGFYKTS